MTYKGSDDEQVPPSSSTDKEPESPVAYTLMDLDIDGAETLEAPGYSFSSYLQNVLNILNTTSFLIDPTETFSEKKRVQMKSLLILFLSRMIDILEEGWECRNWIDDSLVRNCTMCRRPFNIVRRKHHCRICGRIFCRSCSRRKLLIPVTGTMERVCDICYVIYSRLSTAGIDFNLK